MRLFEFVDVKKKAVFTAGLPGSGKSSIVQKVLGHTGMRVIDVDKFYSLDLARGQQPGNYDKYAASAKKIIDHIISTGKGLILDGTGTNVQRYSETKKTLEEKGYDTILLYVATDPEIAKERAGIRAAKTGRTVDVQQYDQNLRKAFDPLTKLFDTNIIMVDNNSSIPEVKTAFKKMSRFLNKW